MNYLVCLVAAAIAVPAGAQSVPIAASAPGIAAPAPDAERVALARQAAQAVWPDGTYARLMKGSMDQMMDSVMASMMDMKVTDIVPADAKAKADPAMANASFREILQKGDPAFQERMRITNHVMMTELADVFTKFEPELREGIAQAYARKFTAAQLTDINRFFASPAGQAYASEAMMAMMDPEVMTRMTKAMPAMMHAMPGIMAKVEKATAHLPPLPKGKKP